MMLERQREPVIERGHTGDSPAKLARWNGIMKRRMRLPITPYPGESLPGVLARSTRTNVLEENKRLLAMAGIELFNPAHLTVGSAREIARLAEVIGCDVAQLDACANRYVIEGSRIEGIRAGDGVLRRTDLHLNSRRISPLSLRYTDHHRQHWLVNLLPFCPESLELLRDDCSECGAQLHWRRSYGAANCDRCRAIVAPTRAPSLVEDLVDDYRMFASLISSVPRDRQAALGQLPAKVRELEPLALVDLCLQLGALCRTDPVFSVRLAFHHQKPETIASIVAGGVALLRTWPHEAVDRCRAEADIRSHNAQAFYKFRLAIKRLREDSHSRPAQIALVRDAFPDIFTSFNRSFASADAIHISSEACSALSLNAGDIKMLREAGIVRARELPCGSGMRKRFQHDSGDIFDVAQILRDITPAASLAARLGLPRYAIEQMCCLRLVELADHPAVTLLYNRMLVTRSSSAAFLEAMTRQARSGPPPPEAISLFLATRVIGAGTKPWAAIFSALRDGRIPYWLTEGRNFIVRARVAPEAIDGFSSSDFQEASFPSYRFSPYLTALDAEDVLNVGGPELARALPNIRDLVISDQPPLWSRSSVLRLSAGHISISEAARHSKLTVPRTRARLVKSAIRRTPLGWPRAEVMSLDWVAQRS